MEGWNKPLRGLPMLMDRAYEGDETRQLVLDLGFEPVVPPKSNRREPRDYDRDLYKRRNEVERLFAASRAIAASSRALKSSMSCSELS